MEISAYLCRRNPLHAAAGLGLCKGRSQLRQEWQEPENGEKLTTYRDAACNISTHIRCRSIAVRTNEAVLLQPNFCRRFFV